MPSHRTRNYRTQVTWSAVFKIVMTLATLVTTRALFDLLGAEAYGAWSLIVSLQSWILLCDLGIGKGMRNHIARSLALGRITEARAVIASAYALFALICLALTALAIPVILTLDWQRVLNLQAITAPELTAAVAASLIFALGALWAGLISQVCGALQRSALPAGFSALNTTLFMVTTLALAAGGARSIAFIVAIQGALTLLCHGLLTARLLAERPDLRPGRLRPGAQAPALLSAGARFFVLQCAMLVIFATDRLLIARLIGPGQIAQYDMVYKLFSLLITCHVLVVSPLWSAFTDAFHRGEFGWIRRAMMGQLRLVVLSGAAALTLAALAPRIIAIWIGPDLRIDPALPWTMALFAIFLMWNNLFGALLNGIGALRAQIISAAIGAALNIPLSILLVRYLGAGVSGIVLATAASITMQSLALPLAAARWLSPRPDAPAGSGHTTVQA